MPASEHVTIAVDEAHRVSGLLIAPTQSRACYIFAHGAGAGMSHSFMQSIATELGERGLASLRYQFPYMERGLKRVDPPKLAQATVRAAVERASRLLPDLPLLAGGKSFGGRMSSQAQAESPLPGVKGLVFFGFPLHAAGRPPEERAQHLSNVHIPMLFLQGTRDPLADTGLLEPVVARLGGRATLVLVNDGDHSFHVRASSGRTDAEVRLEILDRFMTWLDETIAG